MPACAVSADDRVAAGWTVEVDVTEKMPGVSLEPSAELAELFRRTARRLHRGTGEALAPLGLSGSQARLVRLLADGPLRMSVIAERLAVVARTITDVVDGAETPSGRRLLDQLDAARRQSAARVFGVLTEAQRGQLLALLHVVGASDECSHGSADSPAAAPDVTAGTEAAR